MTVLIDIDSDRNGYAINIGKVRFTHFSRDTGLARELTNDAEAAHAPIVHFLDQHIFNAMENGVFYWQAAYHVGEERSFLSAKAACEPRRAIAR